MQNYAYTVGKLSNCSFDRIFSSVKAILISPTCLPKSRSVEFIAVYRARHHLENWRYERYYCTTLELDNWLLNNVMYQLVPLAHRNSDNEFPHDKFRILSYTSNQSKYEYAHLYTLPINFTIQIQIYLQIIITNILPSEKDEIFD